MIGGSDLAAIMGESKWETKDDLYDRLALGKEKMVKSNETMEKGTKAEANIRNLFALDFADEFSVIDPPTKGYWLYQRKDKPYITCTPDGLLKSKKDKSLSGLEIKYVSIMKSSDHEIWESNNIPGQYYWQCIQYMIAIPNLASVYLFAHLKYFTIIDGVWVFDHAVDKPYVLYREDCESDIDLGEAKQSEFYEDNVLKRKRPALTIDLSNL